MRSRLAVEVIMLIVLVMPNVASAQDPHFTQSHRIPTWYNPAAAGHGVEHIRLTLLYRNQWSSVTSPFKTEGIFFDKQVSRVGFGMNLVNNTAGEAGIRQLYLNGQLSYRLTFGKSMLASGIQIGFIQKSFDPSKMTFDDQYTVDQGFNPSNPTAETFSYTKLTRPDFGTGFLWTYGKAGKDMLLPFAGVSLQHINQPKESFIIDNNFIPRKFIVNAGVGIHSIKSLIITPSITYSQQQFAKELMAGVVVKMPLEERNNVEGGLLFRNKDAIALYAGYQWNSFMLGMSYDANISGLTGGPGAFELTLTYIPKAKVKKEPEKKKAKDTKAAKPAPKKTGTESKVPVTESKPHQSASSGAQPVKEKTTAVAPNNTPAKPPVTGRPKVSAQAKPVTASPAPKTSTTPTSAAAPNAVSSEKPATITMAAVRKITPVNISRPINEEPVRAKVSAPVGLPLQTTEPVVESPVSISPQPEITKAIVKTTEPLPVLLKKETPVKSKREVKTGLPINIAEETVAIAPVQKPVLSPDADGDGVTDSLDHCPYIKGVQASGGCPDTDGDGIIDMEDNCPLEAGDIANKGCAVRKNNSDFSKALTQHVGNIEFKTGSTEVHGLYKLDIIEPALDSLLDHDDMILVITGHTDSEGDAPFNMKLSQDRADVVKAIFMRKGLAEDKITTVAYGETMPLRENLSDEGRQRNRRVEIHVIRKNKP